MVAVYVKYSFKAQQQQWEQIKRIKTQLKRSHPNNTVNNCTFCFKIKHTTKTTKPTKLTSLVMSSLLGVFLVSLCLRNTQWMLPSPLVWHRHGRSPRANRGGSLEESNAERRLLVRTKATPLPVLAQKIMLEGIIMERKKKSSLTGRECGYLWSAHILGGYFFFVCLCALERLVGSDYIIVILWSLPAVWMMSFIWGVAWTSRMDGESIAQEGPCPCQD